MKDYFVSSLKFWDREIYGKAPAMLIVNESPKILTAGDFIVRHFIAAFKKIKQEANVACKLGNNIKTLK